MKRMKIALTVCLMLVPMLAFAAQAPLSDADLKITIGENAFGLGVDATGLIDAVQAQLGDMTVQAADSCMFTGTDKEFENESLLIATYPIGENGGDVVETIFVLDASILTARGVGVGSTQADIIQAYGDAALVDYDQMIYAMGDMTTEPILVFVMDLDTNCVDSYYFMRNTTAQ